MASFGEGAGDEVRACTSTHTQINSRWLKELDIKHRAIKRETSKVLWDRR